MEASEKIMHHQVALSTKEDVYAKTPFSSYGNQDETIDKMLIRFFSKHCIIKITTYL